MEMVSAMCQIDSEQKHCRFVVYVCFNHQRKAKVQLTESQVADIRLADVIPQL